MKLQLKAMEVVEVSKGLGMETIKLRALTSPHTIQFTVNDDRWFGQFSVGDLIDLDVSTHIEEVKVKPGNAMDERKTATEVRTELEKKAFQNQPKETPASTPKK